MKDYIRLGLAVKIIWDGIDFETVEIHEVPFGKACFKVPVTIAESTPKLSATLNWPNFGDYWMENIDMQRLRIGTIEFMVGYGFNKLLVGVKDGFGKRTSRNEK